MVCDGIATGRWQTYARKHEFETMKTLLSILAASLLVVPAAQARREVIHKGDIVVVPMQGEIAPSIAACVRRAVKTTEAAGASAIIFEMNTYGGRLDSAEEISNALNRATIPTYTYVNTNAGSAVGALAPPPQHIYLHPRQAIGAAAPVLPTGQDLPITEREKT